MTKRIPVIREVSQLYQDYEKGRLVFSREYQRRAVWPRAAKSGLIASILKNRPVPPVVLQRFTSAQSGRSELIVIDGQQRLRAIFDFLNNHYPLGGVGSESKHGGRRFGELSRDTQHKIESYELVVEELSGYSEGEIEDIFTRSNRFSVAPSSQDLLRLDRGGAFYDHVQDICAWDFWHEEKVFGKKSGSDALIDFVADLTVLLIEGPQGGDFAMPVYLAHYRQTFPESAEVSARLRAYLDWVLEALPTFKKSRYSKPAELYALVGALNEASDESARLSSLSTALAGQRLLRLQKRTRSGKPTGQAQRYVAAIDHRCNELVPRMTRVAILRAAIEP